MSQSQPWARVQPHRGRNAGDACLTPSLPYLHKRVACRLSKRSAPVAGIACQRLHWVRWKPQALRRFADDLVPDDLLPPVFSRTKTTSSEKGLSVRRIVWLALAHPEKRNPEQAQEVIRASFLHPEVAIALTLAQAFVKMVRERDVEALPAWLAEVQANRGIR